MAGFFRSEDKGETWQKMNSTNPRPMYYSQIRIDPNSDQRIWVLGSRMSTSYDGGKTFKTNLVTRIHVDFHALWINPANSNHMILGSDGGINISYDRGKTWDFINNLPLGQFYEVGYDMQKPYNVYGGLQDNGIWGAPSATRFLDMASERIGITNEDWLFFGGGDGFYVQVDPNDPDILYSCSQNGGFRRMNLYTKETKGIKPEPEDEKEKYRFNWNSPILISPHNSQTIYCGGNKLFKSTDMGDTWTASPDLTTQQDREKLPIMGILPDKNTLSLNDGISSYGNITTVSESPVGEGILWVGTDDGNLQLSKDGGITWINLIDRVKGIPKYTYVSRVVASHFIEARAYVTFDGHRNNDFKSYVYATEDFGKTWKSLANDLPSGGSVNVIREHHRNQNLLFVGTERGAYFSINRGNNWIKFEGNLPTVPVDDIAIHPRENDLIFGTHGRSIFILDDITPLEELSKEVLDSESHFFTIRPAERFQYYKHKGDFTDHRMFIAPNPPYGAIITYYINCELDEKDEVVITILDSDRNKIRELKGTKNQSFNRIKWDLRHGALPVERERRTAQQRTTQALVAQQRRSAPSGPFVVPGEYTVKLTVKEKTMSTPVVVELDPRIKISIADLIAQRDSALKLDQLSAKASRVNGRIQDLESQVENVKKVLKKGRNIDEAIMADIDSLAKKLSDIRNKLMVDRRRIPSWRSRRTVTRDINSLSRSITSYTAAPTTKNIKKIEKLFGELNKIIEEMNNLITVEIPKLNKRINEIDILFLDPGKVIKK